MALKRKVFSFAAASVFAISLGTSALASTATVTHRVTPGQMRAWVEGGTINTVTYSHGSQDTSWDLNLRVDDSRGTYAGWSVTVQSSDFVYRGAVAGEHDIPAAHFVLSATGLPAWLAGQEVDGGISGSDYNGPLNNVQTPMTAKAGHGSGHYVQALPVTLMVPEGSPSGEYVATLTVQTAAAPN